MKNKILGILAVGLCVFSGARSFAAPLCGGPAVSIEDDLYSIQSGEKNVVLSKFISNSGFSAFQPSSTNLMALSYITISDSNSDSFPAVPGNIATSNGNAFSNVASGVYSGNGAPSFWLSVDTSSMGSLSSGACSGSVIGVDYQDSNDMSIVMPYAIAMSSTLSSGCTLYSDNFCTTPFTSMPAGSGEVMVAVKCNTNGSASQSITVTDACSMSGNNSFTVSGATSIYPGATISTSAGATGQENGINFLGDAGEVPYFGSQQIDITTTDPNILVAAAGDTNCSSPITHVSGTDLNGATVTICATLSASVGTYYVNFTDHASFLTGASIEVDVN